MSYTIIFCFSLQFFPIAIFSPIENCQTSNYVLEHYTNLSYFIGGLFSMQYNSNISYWLNEGNILAVSSMMLAVQEINESNDILPGIQLGYEIRDTNNDILCTCEQALDFLLDKSRNSTLIGVVGPASSSLSVSVSTMLLPDFVPQVSYASTSILLSERYNYQNFFRTVPTDNYQAKAIVDLIDQLQWTYVSLFTSNDDYGRFGRYEIINAAKDKNICFSVDQVFDINLSNRKVDVILESIEKNSRIVVLWCEIGKAETIIQKSIERGLTNITWIGTETWRIENLKYFDANITHNIIFLQLEDYPITALSDNIFKADKTSQINCENIWYKELLRKYTLNDTVCLPTLVNFLPKGYSNQVYSAVYALAYGLHVYLNCSFEKCSTYSGPLDYEKLYNNNINTQFTVPSSNYSVKFDKNGEFLFPAYQYMFVNQKDLLKFGTWKYNPNNVVIYESLIAWKNNLKPKSTCSLNCNPGTYRVNSTLSKCCWICEPCLSGSISISVNEYFCTNCSLMSMANSNQTQCNNMVEISLDVFSTSGILIIIGSLSGVFCTNFILMMFVKHWNHIIIKSTNKEMSCLQIMSLKFLFCIAFIYFWKPTPSLCVLRTSLFGFFFTTVSAFAVVKTFRLLCVFNCRLTKVSKLLDNKFQIGFTFLIVLFQIIAVTFRFIYNQNTVEIVPNSAKNAFYRVCTDENPIIWISLTYYFILAIICGCMAFRARRLPENYKETQTIIYALLNVSILWIAYLPLQFSVDSHKSMVSFLAINILSCYCMLIILYGKKMFHIFHNQNLKQSCFYKKSAKIKVHDFVEKVVQVNSNVVRSNRNALSENNC